MHSRSAHRKAPLMHLNFMFLLPCIHHQLVIKPNLITRGFRVGWPIDLRYSTSASDEDDKKSASE